MINLLHRRRGLVGLLFLYLAAIGAVFWSTGDWVARQTWAVVLTGAVVLWYTWETMRLRETAQEQINIQLRPFVVLRPAPGGVALENLGPGPALNVRVRDVVIHEEERIRIEFPGKVPILRTGASAEVKAVSYHGDKSIGDFFVAHIDPRYATLELDVTIEYQNVDLKTYRIVQTSSPKQMVITGFHGPDAA